MGRKLDNKVILWRRADKEIEDPGVDSNTEDSGVENDNEEPRMEDDNEAPEESGIELELETLFQIPCLFNMYSTSLDY